MEPCHLPGWIPPDQADIVCANLQALRRTLAVLRQQRQASHEQLWANGAFPTPEQTARQQAQLEKQLKVIWGNTAAGAAILGSGDTGALTTETPNGTNAVGLFPSNGRIKDLIMLELMLSMVCGGGSSTAW